MKKEGLYTSGEFAKKAHVTKKTLRYYNDHDFLKPTYVDEENGYKLYTDMDFEKLQRILLLKYLGFSLEDIKNSEPDTDYLQNINNEASQKRTLIKSLEQQLALVDEKINQMSLVREILIDTLDKIQNQGEADWSVLLQQVTETSLKNSLMQQYVDTSNISARIKLHALYSRNEEKWFPWIYRISDIHAGMNILELGCGNGDFWLQNMDKIPKKINIVLSDNSEGVLGEAGSRFNPDDKRFNFAKIDMNDMSLPQDYADMIIANHCLFYAKDIQSTLRGIKKALKKGGVFICSTYGPKHMLEINELMKRFDDRIVLAAKELYKIFGKTNGENILKKEFSDIEWKEYDDNLYVTESEDLINYITSCHGNQNQYIIDKFKEFKNFVKSEIGKGLFVTKEAGVFICR